jgi:hypothetical protein
MPARFGNIKSKERTTELLWFEFATKYEPATKFPRQLAAALTTKGTKNTKVHQVFLDERGGIWR